MALAALVLTIAIPASADEASLTRTSVNPWDWGLARSMDQGEIVEGLSRVLHCSGQVAVLPSSASDMGIEVQHPGDIRGQLEVALANVDAVLREAGMARENVLSLRFFTTDIDGFLANYDVYTDWISEAGIRPPQSLIGVNRLVLRDLVVEIEVTAGE